jgi:hypothetical protein
MARFMFRQTFFTAPGVEFACGLDVLAVFPQTPGERTLAFA